MILKPIKKTRCYFILTVGDEAYLTDQDPSKGLDSSDTDHLYREIVEGVYYPALSNEDGIKGYFVVEDEDGLGYIRFYEPFYTDADWGSFSKSEDDEVFKVQTYWDQGSNKNE